VSREPKLFAQDIIKRCELLISWRTPDFALRLKSDPMLHDAVLMQLTIIGEAVKNIDPQVLAKEPHIPWRSIAKLRDIVVHVYFGIKDSYIVDIVENQTEELLKAARSIEAAL